MGSEVQTVLPQSALKQPSRNDVDNNGWVQRNYNVDVTSLVANLFYIIHSSYGVRSRSGRSTAISIILSESVHLLQVNSVP